MKLFIEDKRLEILLKQYWPESFFTNEDDAEIIVKDFQIIYKPTMETWQLGKPVSLANVITLIENTTESVINCGNGTLYPKRRIYKIAGDIINLTQKETEILCYLINNPGSLNKKKLLQDIWGYSKEIDTNTLETHLYNIRVKLGDSSRKWFLE